MRNAMAMSLAITALAAAALWAAPATAQTVSVHVVQVRASNEGGEFLDPLLLGLGDRIKREYRQYRNFKRAGSDTEAGAVGQTLSFALLSGRTLTLTLDALDGDQISMQASVTRGNEAILNTALKVRKNRTVLIGVPNGDGKLILAITPTLK